jgi:hypothetical protein
VSVLVEALSLVVPQKVLDVSYPGGAQAFLQRMLEPDIPMRRGVSDDHLVSVAFYNPEDARKATDILEEIGLVAVDDDAFYEFAFVDQEHGPTMPCPWLEFRRHPEGFSYCFAPGTDPTELHVPAGWEPEQSRALEREDIRDIPGRAVKLGEENGLETWLDMDTGRIIRGLPQRAPSGPTSRYNSRLSAGSAAAPADSGLDVDIDIASIIAELTGKPAREADPRQQEDLFGNPIRGTATGAAGDAGVLGDQVEEGDDDDDDEADYERFCNPRNESGKLRLTEIFCAMLDGEGIDHGRIADEKARVTIPDAGGMLYIAVSSHDDGDYIEISASYGPSVPVDRRLAVCEAICRINVGLRTGHFEIDLATGEIRYRFAIDVEELGFTHAAAAQILGMVTYLGGLHRATLMKVAFGGMEPGEVR